MDFFPVLKYIISYTRTRGLNLLIIFLKDMTIGQLYDIVLEQNIF